MFLSFNFHDALKKIQQENLYRMRNPINTAQGINIFFGEKKCINFCSNNYLDLAGHPIIKKAFACSLEKYGSGSGASSYVSGYYRAHQQLEEEIAGFLNRPRALFFSSGYLANLGIIQALLTRQDLLFQDKLNHASLIDGARLSGAKLVRFKHADNIALDQLIAQQSNHRRALIASDGVFSMEGDIASIPSLISTAQKNNALLYIDDAHGIGVLGKEGRGTVAGYDFLHHEVPILVGTLGKAFGLMGAFVVGDHDLIDYLIQKTRTGIYSTALPPAIASAALVSINIVKEESWRREKLTSLIGYFRKKMQEYNFPALNSNTPIQPIIVRKDKLASQLSAYLFDQGFYVSAIRAPTVPIDSARLRVTLTAGHTEAHIDLLCEALSRGFTLFKPKLNL